MFNKVILVGNLTRDPELRYLPSGSAVCNTAIATNRRFKKQDGTQGEEICFIDVSFFGRTAEIANQYLKRGSKVLIEGRLKLDQWQDQNGAKRSKHSVTVENMTMLDSKNSSGGDYNQGGNDNRQNGGYQNNNYQQNGGGYQQQNNGGYQNQAPTQPSQNQVQQTNDNIPDIDIDDDEIPF